MDEKSEHKLNQKVQQREDLIQRILDYIRWYIKTEKRSPSFDEIAEGCLTVRSNVARYIDMLEGRGHIKRIPGVPRSIVLVEPEDD